LRALAAVTHDRVDARPGAVACGVMTLAYTFSLNHWYHEGGR
jgi:hypothetical protein